MVGFTGKAGGVYTCRYLRGRNWKGKSMRVYSPWFRVAATYNPGIVAKACVAMCSFVCDRSREDSKRGSVPGGPPLTKVMCNKAAQRLVVWKQHDVGLYITRTRDLSLNATSPHSDTW